MPRLTWDDEAQYEVGVDRGVLFPDSGDVEVWNGLISVDENPVTLRESIRYRDGEKVINRRAEDSFSASVKTFSLHASLLGRNEFGFSYRVKTATGYKIHLVYQARTKTPGTEYQREEISTFAIDISTRPIAVPEAKPSSHLIVDTSTAYPSALEKFENVLYGTDDTNPRLPLPSELFEMFDTNALYKVIDHGDGTFTLEAPEGAIQMLDDTTFEVSWPAAIFVDENSYRIRTF